jgi:hypothetical protein
MASNPHNYTINHEPLSVKNVINYLLCLKHFDIIPNFMVDITDDELRITTIYSHQFNVSGYTLITYNIYTKKWKGCINLSPAEYGNYSTITFSNIERDFPFVIDNSLLKINYQYPFVEYIIESDYIEDVLEPSLNVFNHPNLNPRNMISNPLLSNQYTYEYYLRLVNINDVNDIQTFYNKIDAHEKHLLFLSKKNIINQNYYLPEELWRIIQSYYIG